MRKIPSAITTVLMFCLALEGCTTPPANTSMATMQTTCNTLYESPSLVQVEPQVENSDFDPWVELIGDILRASFEVMFRAGGEIMRVRR